jgi:hypothetical protein
MKKARLRFCIEFPKHRRSRLLESDDWGRDVQVAARLCGAARAEPYDAHPVRGNLIDDAGNVIGYYERP